MTALPEVQRQQWVGLRLSQTVRTLLWGAGGWHGSGNSCQ
jgi:hypothetical protein